MKKISGLSFFLVFAISSYSQYYMSGIEYGPYSANPYNSVVKSAITYIWVPASIKSTDKVRGVFCASDYASGVQYYSDTNFRKFAYDNKLVMMKHNLKNHNTQHVLSKDSLTVATIYLHLQYYAIQISHPELAFSGLIHTGLSQSGTQAFAFSMYYPDQTIATVQTHPSTASIYQWTRYKWSDTRVHRVPMLYNIGGKDLIGDGETWACSRQLLRQFIAKARPLNPVWSGYIDKDVGHSEFKNHTFTLQWLQKMIDMRIPAIIPDNKYPIFNTININSGLVGYMQWDRQVRDTNFQEAIALRVYPYSFYKKDEDTLGPPCTNSFWIPDQQTAINWAKAMKLDLITEDKKDIVLQKNQSENISFPNPVNEKMTILFTTNEEGVCNFKLINNTGVIIESSNFRCMQGNNELNYNLEKLNAGIYFIQLIQNNILIMNRKIIKK